MNKVNRLFVGRSWTTFCRGPTDTQITWGIYIYTYTDVFSYFQFRTLKTTAFKLNSKAKPLTFIIIIIR